MMGYGFGSFGGPWLGMLWGGLVWVAIVALLVWAVVALTRSGRRSADEDALDILKRRFASGAITEAEFEQAKRRLAA